MKKSELRQIIKEEIASMSAGVGEQYASKDILDEDVNDNLFGRKHTTKLSDVDPITGTKTFDVNYAPDFNSLLQNVEDSYNIAKNLLYSSEIKSSDEFDDIYMYVLKAKNSLRQYLRTYYRDEYNNLKETMKKSELRQIIREEVSKINEGALMRDDEYFERMEGLANIRNLKTAQDMLRALTTDWWKEGFEKEDIINYFTNYINQI